MKTKPVSMPADMKPACTYDLYRDTNGNWFVSYSVAGGYSGSTSTYTEPMEALEVAYARTSEELGI